jgi:hypothetical protein
MRGAQTRDATRAASGGRRRQRHVPRLLVAVIAMSALAGGAATAAVLSIEGGDTPLQTPSPVIRTTGTADRKISVDAYPAQDGLCLRALEPSEPDGSSIACVNPSEAPYIGTQAFGVALVQRRQSGTTVLGLTSTAARTVAFHDREGNVVSVTTRALPSDLSVSTRLRVVVADLPASYTLASAEARDSAGRSLATIDLTPAVGGAR